MLHNSRLYMANVRIPGDTRTLGHGPSNQRAPNILMLGPRTGTERRRPDTSGGAAYPCHISRVFPPLAVARTPAHGRT